MATLEKIRKRAGLLAVVIGFALLAFIMGDLLNSGQTLFRMSADKVAEVNGERISTGQYQERVDEITEAMKLQTGQSALSNEMSIQINQNAYESLINEILIDDATQKIGMTVSSEELADILQGDNISPMIQQLFRNPQTGQFDKSMLLGFLQSILSIEEGALGGAQAEQLMMYKNFWLYLEKSIKQQRLIDKYNGLLVKAIMPNKLDLQSAYEAGKESVDFLYAVQPYSSIPDSSVTIEPAALQKLYNSRKELFKQDETRNIKYFVVDINPSAEDYKLTEEKITELKEEFSTTTDVADLVNLNSDQPYLDAYVAESDLPAEVLSFVKSAKVNDVKGPFLENDSYKMYRLMGTTMAPDSVKARHIALPLQDEAKALALADSLINVLNKGGDFAALAQEFSVDQSTAANGGDLGWFTEVAALNGVGQEFKNACFSAKEGTYFTVRSDYVIQIIQVTGRTKNVPKANVATFVMNVLPSNETFNTLYNEVNQCLANSTDVEKFEANAQEKGYHMFTDATLNPGDYSLGPIQYARQVIKWAFNNKKGSVSEIFEIDNKFIAAAVTEIYPRGYASLEQVEPALKSELLAEKKSQMIMDDLKAKNLSTMDAYAQAMNSAIDTAKYVTFNTRRITGIGDEPALCGLVPFAAENQVSAPVKGDNGVYVFSVLSKTASEKPFDAKAEQATIDNMTSYRVPYQTMDVLRRKADVIDNRIAFF